MATTHLVAKTFFWQDFWKNSTVWHTFTKKNVTSNIYRNGNRSQFHPILIHSIYGLIVMCNVICARLPSLNVYLKVKKWFLLLCHYFPVSTYMSYTRIANIKESSQYPPSNLVTPWQPLGKLFEKKFCQCVEKEKKSTAWWWNFADSCHNKFVPSWSLSNQRRYQGKNQRHTIVISDPTSWRSVRWRRTTPMSRLRQSITAWRRRISVFGRIQTWVNISSVIDLVK